MKPRELNEKDREELSFLFNLDYEMSMGEKGGWKGGLFYFQVFGQTTNLDLEKTVYKPDLFTWYNLAQLKK